MLLRSMVGLTVHVQTIVSTEKINQRHQQKAVSENLNAYNVVYNILIKLNKPTPQGCVNPSPLNSLLRHSLLRSLSIPFLKTATPLDFSFSHFIEATFWSSPGCFQCWQSHNNSSPSGNTVILVLQVDSMILACKITKLPIDT